MIYGSSKAKMLRRSISRICMLVAVLGAAGILGFAQGRFEIVTGKLFHAAVPRDFYLEGNAIPVEQRNTVLIRTPAETRVLIGLIVTAGFASQLQQKYSGMLISEGHLSICRKRAVIGSYGFGVHHPHSLEQPAQFLLYNQAGDQIMECNMEKDLHMREPKPLQVMIESTDSARLYLGRYWVELRP